MTPDRQPQPHPHPQPLLPVAYGGGDQRSIQMTAEHRQPVPPEPEAAEHRVDATMVMPAADVPLQSRDQAYVDLRNRGFVVGDRSPDAPVPVSPETLRREEKLKRRIDWAARLVGGVAAIGAVVAGVGSILSSNENPGLSSATAGVAEDYKPAGAAANSVKTEAGSNTTLVIRHGEDGSSDVEGASTTIVLEPTTLPIESSSTSMVTAPTETSSLTVPTTPNTPSLESTTSSSMPTSPKPTIPPTSSSSSSSSSQPSVTSSPTTDTTARVTTASTAPPRTDSTGTTLPAPNPTEVDQTVVSIGGSSTTRS